MTTLGRRGEASVNDIPETPGTLGTNKLVLIPKITGSTIFRIEIKISDKAFGVNSSAAFRFRLGPPTILSGPTLTSGSGLGRWPRVPDGWILRMIKCQ